MCERWQNQQEAMEFAIAHPSCMLNMDMGTGKTRVAIDTVFALPSTCRILVVCPKAVVPVWRENLTKFAPEGRWACWDKATGSVKAKKEDLEKWLYSVTGSVKQFVVMNYDCVWRDPMGDFVRKHFFDTVILDESHRAKAAGSKVSFMNMRAENCPGLIQTASFLQEYAVMGGPELRFIVGFKNQKRLNEKFASIAYTCKMSDVADRLKLPEALPPISKYVQLPSKDLRTMKELNKEFVAECGTGHVVVNNVIVKLVRLQQITSGFCVTKESVFDNEQEQELNTAKEDMLLEILQDLDPKENVVVFCIFKHDLEAIRRAARANDRKDFELSGAENTLDDWKKSEGGVIAVQIQAGSEGVDMTKANHAVYFSMPHSLAMYEQSKARLYRPGQTRPVSFLHLIAENTIDESLYRSLVRKKDIIEAIKDGTFDFGYIHR